MARYKYTFESRTEFSVPVSDHSFMLRTTPLNDGLQRLEAASLTVSPAPDSISEGRDVWGSAQDYGIIRDMHREFSFVSKGIIEVSAGSRKDPAHSPVFLNHSALTSYSPAMSGLCAQGDSLDAAARIAASVNRTISYVPGSTDVTTSAEEAFEQGKGVCQDYSHVMIAVCRKCGIPARYVCGFVIGEGETHAWTEIWHEGAWYGFDATSGLRCDDRYIALSFGRDAADCSVSRGVFMGAALQRTQTRVVVETESK